jgi:hypothetical protein
MIGYFRLSTSLLTAQDKNRVPPGNRCAAMPPVQEPVTVRKRIAINSGCEGLCPDAASGSRWGFVLLGCHHVRPSAFDPAVALGPFNKYAQQRIAASLSGFSSSNCGNTL